MPLALKKRFEVQAPLAHGESGTSYLATELEPRRTGLLKVLRPAGESQSAERQRLRRELLKLSTLETSHVATPLASGEVDGVTWIFREYLEGSPLSVKLSGGAPLPQKDALAIAAQLVLGLDDLHRAGLLHRDIQPGHVLLRSGGISPGKALLIDAGLCTAHEVSGHATVLGTPGYVAPEQLQGKLVSFRSDLYALGCVIYEMLTGRPAFTGETVQATLKAQLAGELPKMPEDLPTGVGALLKSLLAREPQERPFSAQKLRRTLDPFLPDGAHVTRQTPQNHGSIPDPRRSLPPSHPRAPEGALQKAPLGSMRPTVPPPPSPSRIPPPPPPSVAPPARSSSFPPPAPSTPDTTQQLDVAQIVEMAGTKPKISVAPPSPQRVNRRLDATETVDFDQLLEVAARPVPRVLSEPPPPPEPRASSPEKRSADMTQPIRLEQILAVADTRKKELEPRPSIPSKGLMVKTPEDTDVDVDLDEPQAAQPSPTRPESKNLSSVPESSKTPSAAALATDALVRAIAEDDEDDDALIPGAGHAHAAGHVTGHDAPEQLPPARASLPPPARASLADFTPAKLSARPAPQEPEPLPSIIVESSPPPPMRPASVTRTLQGVPMAAAVPPEALGQALDTPRSVKVGGGDSGNLTLPREPVSATAAAQRLAYESSPPPRSGVNRHTKIAYGVAAAALLALVMVRVNARTGDTPPVAPAPTGEAAKPVAAVSAEKAPAPAAAPLAEPPKGEVVAAPPAAVEAPQPMPVVEPAQPAPALVAKADVEPRTRARSAEAREERVGRARDKEKEDAVSPEAKLARWAKARDEARAHYAAKRFAQAAASYEEAARNNPSHAGTFAGLGAARLQTGDSRGAIQAYQKAIQLSPTTSGFHAALGKTFMTAGDKAKARTAYRRALALDPKNEAAKQALSELGE